MDEIQHSGICQSKTQPEVPMASSVPQAQSRLNMFDGSGDSQTSPALKGTRDATLLPKMPPLAQLERTRKNGIPLSRC